MTGVDAATREGRRIGRPRDPSVDAAITDATLGLLAEGGFDGITMEAIAARAGIAKATLYRRFASRDDVIRHALGTLDDDVPDGLAILEEHGTRPALVAAVEAMRSRTPRTVNGRIVLRVLAEQATQPQLHALVVERVIEPRARRLRALIERAVERGDLRADLDTATVVALLVGPALYLGMRGGSASSEAVVDAVLAGLAPGPGAVSSPSAPATRS